MSRYNVGWQIANMVANEHLIAGTASDAGPSPKIWSDCPLAAMMFNPGKGYFYSDDFMGPMPTPAGTTDDEATGWTITRLTAGTIGSIIGVGGELHLASSSTTDQGIQAQLLNCCVKPTAGKTIWFEARVQVDYIDNLIFVGLASTDTTLIASGVLDETNPSSIGFFTDENSTTSKGGTISQKAGTNDTHEDCIDMAASTWYNLGFKVDGVSRIEFYQDGELVDIVTDTNDIADATEMALSLVCQNQDGANANTLKVDWVRVAQLR